MLKKNNCHIFKQKKLWWIFIIFTLILFFKSVLFHYFGFHSILISSLWKHPIDFVLFYMPKLLPAMVIASFVFITQRHYWTIVVSFLLDIWIIANLVYFRANNTFLGVEEILMVNNMNGTWQSVQTYFKWVYLSIPMLSVIYLLVFLYFLNSKYKRNWICFVGLLLIFEFFSLYQIFRDSRFEEQEQREYKFEVLNPMYNIREYAIHAYNSSNDYVERHSIIMYFPMMVSRYIEQCSFEKVEVPSPYEIDTFCSKIIECNDPSHNLILILVESFESWTINVSEIDSNIITPNILRIKDNPRCIYFPNTRSEVRQGVSGDGQMILTTGLLPINSGVACMKYGHNTYPSIVQLYNHSLLINSWPHIWNQDVMNQTYGYIDVDEPLSGYYSDKEVFSHIVDFSQDQQYPFLIYGITCSSHTPFRVGKKNVLHLPEEMPSTLNYYMNSIHYMDSCFGIFMDCFDTSEVLQNSTIIITGDHTFFKDNMMQEFAPYVEKNQFPIPTQEGFVPFIIYSPKITEHRVITDTIYQMDIYPTILNLIDCEDYYWKGFGVNVLNDSLRYNRPITEEDAYKLSNKIIVNNYFKSYLDSVCPQQ